MSLWVFLLVPVISSRCGMDNHERQPQDLPQVLVIEPPEILTLFGDKFPSVKFQLLKAYESLLPLHQFLTARAVSVQAVLCYGGFPVTPDLLRSLPALRLIVTASIGVHHINLAECKWRGVAVAKAGNVFSDDCADAAVGLLIDVLREISAAYRYVRRALASQSWEANES